ncbi:MAG TPA: hypothetical protein ENI86_14640 [Acidimicrobiales bacterium]|nr:hypothetical protein [Acidimicrobiales bacterium]
MLAITFRQGIEDAWSNVAQFIPKLIGALIILLIGLWVARIIRKIVHRVLTRLRFDQVVDRSGLGGHLERAGYADSALLLAKVVYYGVVLIVLKLAIGAFGQSDIQDALDSMLAFIPKIFVALIIVVITGAVASGVRNMVSPAVAHLDYGKAITRVVVAAIWTIGVFAALDQIQIAQDIVDTLFKTIVASLGAILVIMFGVGGVWAARDRFWPRVFDRIEGLNRPDPTES